MTDRIRVTVWNEFVHEKKSEAVRKIYADGMHMAIARGLEGAPDVSVSTATLEEPEHGLTDDALAKTDVLIWWGHTAHKLVEDEIAERVRQRVLSGMGFMALHSAHFSKPFRLLMGTNCSLKWREVAERERLWTVEPGHPIARGIGDYIELPHTEMYGERFDIPTPEQIIFLSWFQGGEVFRSGCTWRRGHGKIFYFRPGHETFPIYHDEQILTVLLNAVRWLKPDANMPTAQAQNVEPVEDISQM